MASKLPLPSLISFEYVVQNVMVDLTFNMGSGASGFGGFGSFIADVCAGSWAAAGSNLQGTLWCTQVGQRCSASAADGGDVEDVDGTSVDVWRFVVCISAATVNAAATAATTTTVSTTISGTCAAAIGGR